MKIFVSVAVAIVFELGAAVSPVWPETRLALLDWTRGTSAEVVIGSPGYFLGAPKSRLNPEVVLVDTGGVEETGAGVFR